MNTPLPYKEIKNITEFDKRVLFLNPKDIFDRVYINHHKRNPILSMWDLFPGKAAVCSCGCGKQLTGRRTRWADSDCSFFANNVYNIIAGRLTTLQYYLKLYYGWNCQRCGCQDRVHSTMINGVTTSWIKVDHIVPVKHGGGGWWLSNYQLLCHDCHVQKTKEDFGWKGQNKNQSKLFNTLATPSIVRS